jgi:hypothetical protein
LQKFGLVDASGTPTWFTGGKPDLDKLLTITGGAIEGMSPQDRAVYGRAAFGAQGQGFISVVSDPQVRQQMRNIHELIGSKAYQDRYASFGPDFVQGSTIQDAKVALAEFNVLTGEIARGSLPAINEGLRILRNSLEGIRGIFPAGEGPNYAKVGGGGIVGAGAGLVTGATIGALGGPVGALGGAAIGGVLGAAASYMEQHGGLGIDRGGSYTSPGKTGKPAQPVQPIIVKPSITLNVDGRVLSRALTEAGDPYQGYVTQAPAADGMGQPRPGGDQHTSN